MKEDNNKPPVIPGVLQKPTPEDERVDFYHSPEFEAGKLGVR